MSQTVLKKHNFDLVIKSNSNLNIALTSNLNSKPLIPFTPSMPPIQNFILMLFTLNLSANNLKLIKTENISQEKKLCH